MKRMRAVLTMLILLLGIQLTGLNCIGEWSPQSIDDLLRTALEVAHAADHTDDDCPCHLSFVSTPRQNVQAVARQVILDHRSYESAALEEMSLPFHPPVTL